MEIIKEEVKSYFLTYEDEQGDGYAFPCDAHGNILWGEVYSPETTRKSLAFCKSHPERWTSKCGEVMTLTYHEYCGKCPSCGRRVYFGGGVAECCGKRYNIFGQEILLDWEGEPWEEENYWETL